MDVVLSDRALNRATLHRQHLLVRGSSGPLQIIRLLAGMQGQDPELPYFGLWNRIAGFRIAQLESLLLDRQVARATLFRCTQHLLATSDYVWIRPLLGPMLDRMRRSFFGRVTAGVDPAELIAETRAALAAGPLTRSELGRVLRERWPAHEGVWLARAAQVAVPVVHPHPDGTWGRRGPTPFALAEHWLRGELQPGRGFGELVLRYLAGFGPAGVRDMQAWSGLTRMREVFEELRPRLRTYRSEHGTELFDLPDIVLPDPDTPAPVRFLAGFDNVTFGYADRRRIIADEHRPFLVVHPALTVDGRVRGYWKQKAGSLTVRTFSPLAPADESAVHTEGRALLDFAAPGSTPEITILPATPTP
jgi:hypothetical protein